MPNTESIEKVRPRVLDGWERLAQDTEEEIARATERINKLREALRIFRENAKRGEFFPASAPVPDQPQNA
jgi:hypothetical protein